MVVCERALQDMMSCIMHTICGAFGWWLGHTSAPAKFEEKFSRSRQVADQLLFIPIMLKLKVLDRRNVKNLKFKVDATLNI